jgi:uncharacterized protein YbjT (DUF2867 family)
MSDMSNNQVRTVLVLGATGNIGREVVTYALSLGLTVRAATRNSARTERLLSGAEVVEVSLNDPESLRRATDEIDAVVFTHGSSGDYEAVDYGVVKAVLDALDGRPVRIALMTTIGITHRGGGYQDLMDWKRRSERLVRASGNQYTVVRPSWFDRVSPGDRRLLAQQGDTGDGGVSRDQIAAVLVNSLLTDGAANKTFELFATAGPEPADWNAFFAPLAPDTGLDGIRDAANMPLDREPARVTADLEHVAGHRK